MYVVVKDRTRNSYVKQQVPNLARASEVGTGSAVEISAGRPLSEKTGLAAAAELGTAYVQTSEPSKPVRVEANSLTGIAGWMTKAFY